MYEPPSPPDMPYEVTMVITLTLQMREGGLCLRGCGAMVGAGCEPRMDPRAHIPKMLQVLLCLMGGYRPEHVCTEKIHSYMYTQKLTFGGLVNVAVCCIHGQGQAWP